MTNKQSEDEILYWKKIALEATIVAISKCEEAAKQLISLNSVAITLYIGIISFSDILKQPLSMRRIFSFVILPLPFWLIGLILSMGVIIPQPRIIDQIKSDYIRIGREKYRFLLCSYVFLFLSMVVLIVVIVIYFLYIPPLLP